MQHESRAESYGVPFLQIRIDTTSLSPELVSRRIELAVMVQVVDANLESAFD
jgi:hypothetical protein